MEVGPKSIFVLGLLQRETIKNSYYLGGTRAGTSRRAVDSYASVLFLTIVLSIHYSGCDRLPRALQSITNYAALRINLFMMYLGGIYLDSKPMVRRTRGHFPSVGGGDTRLSTLYLAGTRSHATDATTPQNRPSA